MLSNFEDHDETVERLRFLGRRVERIIFVGLILSLVSFGFLMLSTKDTGRHVPSALDAINKIRNCVHDIRETKSDGNKKTHDGIRSSDLIRDCEGRLIFTEYDTKPSDYNGYLSIKPFLNDMPEMSNEKIDQFLLDLAQKISTDPIRVSSLEIPQKIVLNIFENKFSLNLLSDRFNLSILYGIILLVWIVTYKRTRTAELFAIKKYAKDTTYIYPHLLNTFPSHPVIFPSSNWFTALYPILSESHGRARVIYSTLLIEAAFWPFITSLALPGPIDTIVILFLLSQVPVFFVVAHSIESEYLI